MGQYYKPVLISEDGSFRTLIPREYKNFPKLMEHSYIGNKFVNAVCTLIWKNPTHLAWMGDYSDDVYGDPYERKLPREEFMRYFQSVWGDEDDAVVIRPKARNVITLKSRRYIINHTQRCYINLREYIAKCKWTERGGYVNGEFDPTETWDMCVHPLPLLTACGNDRGSGDYHEGYPDYNRVGEWAFDLIECSDKKPEGYEQLDVTFTERHTAA